MRRVYLDHNATTPTRPEVVEAMLPYYSEVFGNPSSIHYFGRRAKEAVERAREEIAAAINTNADEIIFTSGGTEANNFAIKGVAFANQHKGNHIITSAIEHYAVLNICKYLENKGFSVTYLQPDKYGLIDVQQVEDAIRDETILITIMHANNEIGTIEPISQIGKLAREKNIYFHTDAVQTVGKIEVDVNDLYVDLLSISGHKLYGPKGIGALYIRKGTRIEPQMHGGHHEFYKRAGTENVASIVGFAKAVQLAVEEREEQYKKLLTLSKRLLDGINEHIPDVYFNGHADLRLPNTLNLSFKFVEGESIILNLDLEGIAVSTGSACSSGSLEPSHVLKAIGVPHEYIHGSVRFSLGRETTQEDIDYTIEVLVRVIERLRSISPFVKK